MAKVMIVCGYGKNRNADISEYIEFSCWIAKIKKMDIMIVSGGDTTDESNGPWKTEAEMMRKITQEAVSRWAIFNAAIKEETAAYNTLTNILYSLRAIEGGKPEKIFIVCNRAHFGKVLMASLKALGFKETHRRVIIDSFPLTTRASENIKILLKTLPESLGYFIRPIGRRLEYLQYKRRTGRNEQINLWQFRARFIPTGELK